MAKGKGILALLAAPKEDSEEGDMEETVDEGGAAEDLMDAIKSEDPAALKEAFRALYHECSGED